MKKEVIQGILDAYQSQSGLTLSAEEISDYIHSVNFLNDILHFSKTAAVILDCETLTYLYVSSNVKAVTGHEQQDLLKGGPAFGISLVHPDDFAGYTEMAHLGLGFLLSLPPKSRTTNWFSFTFRLVHPRVGSVSILQNNYVLKWSDNGRPLIKLLLLSDISSYKTNSDLLFFITQLNPDGERTVIEQRSFTRSYRGPLTKQETKIIDLISHGLSVPVIAQVCSISESTVKNSKANILKKLGCTNTAHAVALASLYGFTQSSNFLNGHEKSRVGD